MKEKENQEVFVSRATIGEKDTSVGTGDRTEKEDTTSSSTTPTTIFFDASRIPDILLDPTRARHGFFGRLTKEMLPTFGGETNMKSKLITPTVTLLLEIEMKEKVERLEVGVKGIVE